MKRFFRKDPPPGWAPPPLTYGPLPVHGVSVAKAAETFALYQKRLHEASVAARQARIATPITDTYARRTISADDGTRDQR